MTRSFGNPNLEPGRPKRPAANLQKVEPSTAVQAQKVDVKRRGMAFAFDIIAGYLVSMVIGALPYINRFANQHILFLAYLLLKDWLFQGRGVGKNFMGMRVVDAATGEAPSILQSAMRNMILFAPFIVLETIGFVLTFVQLAWLNKAVMGAINVVGMAYCFIVLPLECYRAYTREDSLRIGDELAQTVIVDADMDFSSPFPKS